jgi:hypothetical protein
MKIISKSEAKELGLKRYFTGKPCKHGHIAERKVSKSTCVECSRLVYHTNKDHYSEKAKLRYQDNRERISKKNKANRAERSEYQRKYIEDNRQSLLNKRRKYTEENREVIREQRRRYRKKSPMNEFMRNSLNRILTNWKGKREDAEIENGYTCKELRKHIESQFKDGMSWDNRGEWHIDHIKPISLFLKEGEKDPKIINALSNLQPLWALDNQSKSCKYEE